ncbi:MAG TPA: NAD(P)-binding domain-containing protein [Jiangellaceae bacterium]|nr:NAD(P)-binding domain-containing protein [Jiangellaceae bacterium]
MRKIDTVVVGAGHAGLATSRCLTDAGRDHVVLDRARLAESWRSARWDSLRLLTPNWMTRLPGWRYQGPDSGGFMTAAELSGYLDAYARSFGTPVQTWTAVTDVAPLAHGYRVTTTQGSLLARNVVMATGARPHAPDHAARFDPTIRQIHTNRYRSPDQLPEGGVLVVGASASGAQIAAELRQAGRDVVLAVGAHTRLPRRHRGMDIMWWLQQIGALSRTIDQVRNPRLARREPSIQLRGEASTDDLNLATLNEAGVVITGRLTGADGHRVRFGDDLPVTIAAAEARLMRTLAEIDHFIDSAGLEGEVLPKRPVRPVGVTSRLDALDLKAAGISTVVWATGFRHRYPWLRVPVFDRHGDVRQYRGITPAPGLYVIGQRFLHRRDSSFIDGARHDARAICEQIETSDRSRPVRPSLPARAGV